MRGGACRAALLQFSRNCSTWNILRGARSELVQIQACTVSIANQQPQSGGRISHAEYSSTFSDEGFRLVYGSHCAQPDKIYRFHFLNGADRLIRGSASPSEVSEPRVNYVHR